MGLQGNGEDTHKRDAISANKRVRSGHSNRGRTHILQGGQSWWKQERRDYVWVNPNKNYSLI